MMEKPEHNGKKICQKHWDQQRGQAPFPKIFKIVGLANQVTLNAEGRNKEEEGNTDVGETSDGILDRVLIGCRDMNKNDDERSETS